MEMKLFIQFPTRWHPQRAKEYLIRYMSYADDLENITIHLSCDSDDKTMKNEKIWYFVQNLKNVYITYSNNKTKVEAINAGVEEMPWGILLLASDDMWPEVKGYDTIIREGFKKHFPDTDGVLHFNDGKYGDELNTLAIIGRKYYDRFGFIYNPKYKSIHCDREFDEISKGLKKKVYFDKVIIRHYRQNYKSDPLVKRNVRMGKIDRKTYEKSNIILPVREE